MSNNDTKSIPRFDAYEIHGVRDIDGHGAMEQCHDNSAAAFGLYGHITGAGLVHIGDFETRKDAEEIYTQITGKPYAQPKKPVTKVMKMMLQATVPGDASEDRVAQVVHRALANGYLESQDKENENDPDSQLLSKISLSSVLEPIMGKRVTISVQGSAVQSVRSNSPDVECNVIDWDSILDGVYPFEEKRKEDIKEAEKLEADAGPYEIF